MELSAGDVRKILHMSSEIAGERDGILWQGIIYTYSYTRQFTRFQVKQMVVEPKVLRLPPPIRIAVRAVCVMVRESSCHLAIGLILCQVVQSCGTGCL